MSQRLAAMTFVVLLMFAVTTARPVCAAPPTDACSLLTSARVNAVLGVTTAPAKAYGSHDCGWSEPHSVAGKTVFVEIVGPIGSLTPTERFNTMKMPVPIKGVVKTPVSGIGDDAVYVTTNSTMLAVKKGGFVFSVRVTGFPTEQAKAKEKTLAQDVLAKL